MNYSSKHLALLFGVSLETVRNWCDEFNDYLSMTANPGKGRHRSFTEEDMGVMSLVSQFKRQGMMYEDIHVALKSGERGEIPALGLEEISALANDDNERALTLQVESLSRQLQTLHIELEKAKEIEKENIRLKADLETERKMRQELEKNSRELTDRMMEIQRELGKAQGILEYLQEQNKSS